MPWPARDSAQVPTTPPCRPVLRPIPVPVWGSRPQVQDITAIGIDELELLVIQLANFPLCRAVCNINL